MKYFFLIFIVVFSIESAFASPEIEWVKTKGVILEIDYKASRRGTKEIATISYTTEDGMSLESFLELPKIPILGSFRSVGDEIDILYDKNKPAYIETKIGSYITQYGMYVLIILGIFFSLRTLKTVYSKS